MKIQARGPWWAIKNKTDVIEVEIFGEIGWEVTVEGFRETFDELKASAKPMRLLINSPGGDVFEGLALYNLFAEHRQRITTEVLSLAASMASIIFLAGDERIMREGSLYMIHNPWTVAFGGSEDLRKTAETLDTVRDQLLGIYERHSGLTRDEIGAMMDEETWISAEDAEVYGFATGRTQTQPMAASISPRILEQFRNTPAALKAQDQQAGEQDEEPRLTAEELDDIVHGIEADNNTANHQGVALENNNEPEEGKEGTTMNPKNTVQAQAGLSEAQLEQIVDKVAAKMPAGRQVGGEKPMDEYEQLFARVLISRGMDKGLLGEIQGAANTTGGAFPLPENLADRIHQMVAKLSIMRQAGVYTRQVNPGNFTVRVPGNIAAAAIINEGEDYIETEAAINGVQMVARKIGQIYTATEELNELTVGRILDDFAVIAARTIAITENKLFLIGNTAAAKPEPQGVFPGATNTNTAASASAIIIDEVLDLYYGLEDNAGEGAFWVMNPTTLQVIAKLKDGAGQYVFLPSNMAGNSPGTILGSPVYTSSFAPTIATGARTIAVVNPGAYGIADWTGMDTAVEPNFKNAGIQMRWGKRFDGKIIDQSGVNVLVMG